MLYVCLLIFGFIGILIMAGMGGLRSGGARTGHGARGSAVPRGGHGVAKGGHGHARGAKVAQPRSAKASVGGKLKFSWLFDGFSPLDLMAMAVGAGAAGIIGRKVFMDEAIAAGMAVAGAFIMDFLIVKPIFSAILRFASQPSTGLEGMITQQVTADSAFDTRGRGLIRLSLDGQTSQVLAQLGRDEVEAGVVVRKGDPLIVVEVDAMSGACTVSREIATSD